MHNILVVVDEHDTAVTALQNAIDRADRDGATLVVANVMPQRAYEARYSAVSGTPALAQDGFTYTLDQAREEATAVAERAARTAVGDRDVSVVAVGDVGRPLSVVPAIAAEHDCDRIYVAASRPRLFGLGERLGLFERFDRTLARAFDGTVVPVRPLAEGSPEPVGSVSKA